MSVLNQTKALFSVLTHLLLYKRPMSGAAGTGTLAAPSGLGTPKGDLELGVSPGEELVGEPEKD